MKKSNPIGIFDSGVGGLTVYREIRKAFPYEDIVYFGDTARVPYGSKSKNTIIDYSIQNARFLLQQGCKVIVVACNTASAVALENLEKLFEIPVIGVIKAGAEIAVNTTKNSKIGVIGTDGTINSKAYQKAIQKLDKKIKVYEKACPLFVSIAEEGWQDTEIAKQIATEYLSDILKQGIDTLVLGCTHYPILKKTIQAVCGDKITLVDSAEATAKELRNRNEELGIRSSWGSLEEVWLASSRPTSQSNKAENQGGIGDDLLEITHQDGKGRKVKDYFYVSDNEAKFMKIAKDILGVEDMNLQGVKLGETWFVN